MAGTVSGGRCPSRHRCERDRIHIVIDERLREVERRLEPVVGVPVIAPGGEQLARRAVRDPHVEAHAVRRRVERSGDELLDGQRVGQLPGGELERDQLLNRVGVADLDEAHPLEPSDDLVGDAGAEMPHDGIAGAVLDREDGDRVDELDIRKGGERIAAAPGVPERQHDARQHDQHGDAERPACEDAAFVLLWRGMRLGERLAHPPLTRTRSTVGVSARLATRCDLRGAVAIRRLRGSARALLRDLEAL